MVAISTAILAAAGTAFGLTQISESAAEDSAGTISIVGDPLFVLVLGIAYYAGGYVACRLSRFDGARQGLGTWLLRRFVTVALAVAGAVFGAKYNILEQLDLPRIPIDEGSRSTGGLIALGAILVATAVAAILGGKEGERYHKKIDRAAYGG